MSGEVLALVNYYARSGYARHVQTVCNEVLKKRGGNDPTLAFWRALGLLMEGAVQEAIKEYETIGAREDAQIALPLKIALLHAHKQSKVVDNEEIGRLQMEIESSESNAPDRARLQAALLLWHLGEPYEAKKHVSRLLQLQPGSVPGLTLLGWLELQEAQFEEDGYEEVAHRLGRAEDTINKALETGGGKKDLEALMAKAKLHEVREQYKEALDQLNQVVVLYAWFLPALVEKVHVLLAMGDWEQAIETAERVRSQDQHNIEALRVLVLYSLSQESRYSAATSRLSELAEALSKHEPLNARLYHKVARSFARLAGRHHGVLQLTLNLVDRACKLAPYKSEYAAEYGYQQLLLGDVRGAEMALKKASTLEESSQEVVQYQIKAQILLGNIEEAENQLDFLSAVHTSSDQSLEVGLCHMLMASKKGREYDEGALRQLDTALEAHLGSVRRLPYNDEYFVKLNPDLLLEVAREYLRRCPDEPEVLDPSSPRARLLNKATKLLQIISKQVPGLLDCKLALAQARFIACDFDSALRSCSACTKADPTYASASLLQAQILLRQDKMSQAHAIAEQALAHNFAVRESPLFHLVKAKVLQSQLELQEAVKVLEVAMKLPGVASSSGARSAADAARRSGLPELSVHDRCSIHLTLVEVHLELNQLKEAGAHMQQAIFEFSGGPQEGRVTIANAQLELKKGDVEKALTMLRGVPSENPHYHVARKQLAELYLKYRSDRRQYALCHEELVKANPSVHTYMMLGEAYMHISEPQKAIAAFERALRINPEDASLSSRIGKVLVATHEYAKAIEYYSSALSRDPSKTLLRHELAELYLNLKKHEQAIKELTPLIIDDAVAERDIAEVIDHVSALRLKARVQHEVAQYEAAITTLNKAKTAQAAVLARVRQDSPDQTPLQRQVASAVCVQLGKYYEEQHEGDQALAAYTEALRYDDSSEDASIAQARLHLHRGEHEEAQSICVALMRASPDNLEASMILADLMMQKSDWDAAIYHFTQLLEKKPAFFAALAKMLALLKRAGRLKDVPRFLKQAEKASARAALEPGMRYCKGVYAWYSNNPREALKALNYARRDAEWGERAVQLMVTIYLNPENETNWDELVLVNHADEPPSEAVGAAEKLLRELKSSPRQQVLACYTLMAYKTQAHLEKAVSALLELLNVEREYVPALVCLSQAYLMLKQAPKARNYLKRVAKMLFVAESADEFERGWLLLSDVYIVSGKYDLAEELCRRCLAFNKSCAKAWEFLGVVKEKEMSYKDAASHYESAWKFENEASATVGFKLSFNYLKAQKYVDAIDVCHKVLAQYPDYPKIRKEVLEKARQALRP